ncbi:MAG: hypothetical protein CL944_01755 [Candidatus Diapherotrites archaeon]|uniref:Uncharacterized protein n=1 Tax=Candidatus Iainarchaeum sp. TaxID=3101447 RepID=A0A2D6LQ02_9ARCH|nr:hypothetical protein [Candidatus Diapherotrites archaeon]|tara:strand:+ start:69 stop:389 length:321 start_codon:yes stop_codon:yes gene_type:complete
MNLKETIKPTRKKVLVTIVIFLILSIGSFLVNKTITPSGSCMDATCHNVGFPMVFGGEVTGCGGPIAPVGETCSTSYEIVNLQNIIIDLIFAYLVAVIILEFKVKK